ncbi:MAG: DUF3857 domain-containing protein [Polyangiales bacterium]
MKRQLSLWLLLVVSTGVSVTAAHAQTNPYDAEQRRLGHEVDVAIGSPHGLLPAIEMVRAYGLASPEVTAGELQRLVAARGLAETRRSYLRWLAARVALRRGDRDGARRSVSELGFVTDFAVVGPFDNEGKTGFDEVYGPEEQRSQEFQPGMAFDGKEREVAWRSYPGETSDLGYVDFDAIFRPRENVCGYAQTTVTSARAQSLALLVGAGGAIRVWWNGEPVYADAAYRQPDPERGAAVVQAQRGANRLLVKVCATDSTWGFYLRVADARGGIARGVTVRSAEMPLPAAAARPARRPTLRTTFDELEALAAAEDAPAAALEDLARFLAYTGADDPAERRARQLAARAADLEPTVKRLELASQLATQRGEAMRFVARAVELAPTDPEVVLLQASLRVTSLHPQDALPILEGRTFEGMYALRARSLRARVYEQIDLPHTALALLAANVTEQPNAHDLVRAQATLEDDLGHDDAAVALFTRAVALQWNDGESRRVLLGDALRRQETDAVVAQAEALHRIGADDGPTLRYLANVYEAIGRADDALAALAEAKALAPHDPESLVAEGRLLLRLGRNDEARLSLRAALDLRPQDADTRELLEQIAPSVRADEAYAASAETLLSRRTSDGGYPYTTLQDLTVNTVYANGLGSSFRQIAAQVHDDEGARQFRTYAVQFDPGSQRVEIRLARVTRANGEVLEALQTFEQPLGEPWYRIYYDTRALVVEFPALEPGDTVELRWRVDDVSHRNLFADYYGDLRVLAESHPVQHLEYVLITPPSREFFFNEPGLAGLSHTRTEANGSRVDRFVADAVPAVRTESNMPGPTEVFPYLHVSTYRDWRDVGRWYWGLIQDQLRPDEELRRTVRDLVRGAPDEATKVRRIHDWVVDHTRYVGLEFGIHGFKPYRVTDIVHRGFGDCKDKASLLYAMLTEAGVPAHIVLLRTRRNGGLGDSPASLAVFDHAIAYVPSMNLYLDGTAEHSGTTELPAMDQGVTVLHVWPEGAELRRTPVQPASANRRERVLEADLASDGSAQISVREQVTGTDAAGIRSTYQAEGTRTERFERQLRGLFPGLHLVSQEFEDLADLEVPVRYQYRAEVPQMAQRDGDRLRVAMTTLGDLLRAIAPTASRQYPLELGTQASYSEDRRIRAPQGLHVVQAPESGVAESPFGLLRLTVEREADSIRVKTEFELRTDRVSPSDYPAFRAWVEEADRLLRQRITFGGDQ